MHLCRVKEPSIPVSGHGILIAQVFAMTYCTLGTIKRPRCIANTVDPPHTEQQRQENL